MLALALLAPQADAVLDESLTLQEREAAVKSLGRTREGGLALLKLASEGKLPDELKSTASFALASSPDGEVRALAEKKIPVPKSKDGKPVPPISELLDKKGDAKAGGALFRDAKGPNCISCHEVGSEGRLVGPPLTTIGNKLSREQLFESILTPSAAILMGYENWIVRTKDGDVKTGIKVEDTDDHVTLKDTAGEFIDIPVGKIEQRKQMRLSMMPENLVSALTLQELVDLVEFLTQQR